MSISDSKIFWTIPNPARIPPQTPPAGGNTAEAGRIHIPSQLFRPAESALVFRVLRKMGSDFFKQTPPFQICRRSCLGAEFILTKEGPLGIGFRQEIPGVFEFRQKNSRREAAVPKRSLGRPSDNSSLFHSALTLNRVKMKEISL